MSDNDLYSIAAYLIVFLAIVWVAAFLGSPDTPANTHEKQMNEIIRLLEENNELRKNDK